ncbi:MAG: glycosyltransferase family 2 protein [Bacteroidota bacterium]|nr:glycosyltransferase [Candidatus Kapabacteria bacterium]MDW8219059.1 glycosyltransferase family 2 protein [Bacteroidota bacterium]
MLLEHAPTSLPLVTIVTICYNAERSICPTIESVIAQDYPNLEYIVIDGGSTDSTPALIREYAEARGSRITWWVSEQDSGVSEAFNKGIARHSGKYIGFLNAGDFFVSEDALSRFFTVLQTSPDADIIYGKARLTFEHAATKLVGSPSLPSHKLPTAHQAIYYHRRIWERFGTFSMNYRYAMDYEHYHRVRHRATWVFSDVVLVERPLTSARNSFGNPARTYREYLRADVHHKNPGIVFNCVKFLRDTVQRRIQRVL